MALSEEVVRKVWEKARGMTELSPEMWRKDECGAWIKRDQYGHAHAEFGWKIENVSLGGPDSVENLRPFHHANDYDRASRRARCRMTADQAGIPVTGHIREPRNREA
jgi:hypothetical protein